MENLALLGPAAPEYGWVPAPRYLLRRDRLLAALKGTPPSDVLEIGPGPGMFLQELARSGFDCSALETSQDARELGQNLAREQGLNICFHPHEKASWHASFPLIIACEVLEHIEDDLEALRLWRSWLVPNGTLLLSVPAHQRSWNARDVWAGHVRRYERDQLKKCLIEAGFIVEKIECYGYPLANMLEKIADRRYSTHARVANTGSASARDANTAQSGIDRSADLKWYGLLRSLPGRAALMCAIAAQRAFLNTELGNGYVVRARVSEVSGGATSTSKPPTDARQ